MSSEGILGAKGALFVRRDFMSSLKEIIFAYFLCLPVRQHEAFASKYLRLLLIKNHLLFEFIRNV